ncbi:4Fe-4S binding domain containing protein [Trichomonas vaginalis G3]|uniref:4Fe-4S binding domain containing protein n=1 Tax=Trichomonas vaginalis (strain ATCC PRA-98 / G3) TaxID=412133 RepID=A2EG04_TRIV3|nr:photosystem I iron-sulfur center-related family [Trichomonas vaginalis G3]EAY08460.1 4Fe-4S binding domain containing protein [Trichomonas vaginalis G3]KAI5518108.1 photosystem I iron-sulfur center-related family [Trichomonas vaginalis G3]|eukprot:XP_001320683.1 4Fe-4S binding domain containing protein [Trichomonas vaginalis G3]
MLKPWLSHQTFDRFAKVIIDGKQIDFKSQETILELLSKNNINIPHKCQGTGDCRLCKVLVNGVPRQSCEVIAKDGMIISTKDPNIKNNIENKVKIYASFDPDVEKAYHLIKNPSMKQHHIDITTGSIQLNHETCIDCFKCVDVCPAHVLTKGDHLQTFGYFGLKESGCLSCGNCLEVCPTKSFSITDNSGLFRSAMSKKNTLKVLVADLSIISRIEEVLNLPKNSIDLENFSKFLKNLGFDYFLDQGLINDYKIIKNSTKLINHSTQFYQRTFGSFCPTLTRKYVEYVMNPEKKIFEYLTSPGLDVTTFVVTDFLSKRSEATFYMSNPEIFYSLGLTSNEFLDFVKNQKPSFDGDSLCRISPLGSEEGAKAVTSEKFANAVISTFVKNYTTAKPPHLSFNKVDEGIKVADFHIGAETKAQAAIIESAADVERLLDMKFNNLIYISPNEKNRNIDINYRQIQRDYKFANVNPEAKRLYSKYLEEVDHELAMKRKCTC